LIRYPSGACSGSAVDIGSQGISAATCPSLDCQFHDTRHRSDQARPDEQTFSGKLGDKTTSVSGQHQNADDHVDSASKLP